MEKIKYNPNNKKFQSHFNISFAPLNQVYRFNDFVCTNYFDLFERLILENVILDEKLLLIKEKLSKIPYFKQMINGLNSSNIKKLEDMQLTFIKEKLIKCLDEESIKLFLFYDFSSINCIGYKKLEIVEIEILEECAFYLDSLLLMNKNYIEYFEIINLQELKVLMSEIPNNFCVSHESLSVINEYKKIGVWTNLLTVLNFSFFENTDDYYKKLIKNNQEFSNNLTNMENPENINFCDFQSHCFITNKFYYSKILKNKLSKKDTILSEKTIKCLLIFKLLPKISDFQKHNFFESNNDIIYISHNGLNIENNLDFDMSIARISDYQDIENYKDIFDEVNQFCLKNNLKRRRFDCINYKKLDPFLFRDKMTDFLIDFCENFISKSEIKFNIKFPSSFKSEANNLDFNLFMELYTLNKLSFPLIVKYNSKIPADNHLLSIVLDENGVRNIIEYFRSKSKNEMNCVITNFVNHGGYFYKSFYINEEFFLVKRPSIPDITMENILIKDGFFSFNTKDLQKKDYFNKFFINNLEKIDLEIKKNDLDYIALKEITIEFSKKSSVDLLSLDFIKCGTDFYFLDCNYFPGFKEIDKDLNSLLNLHYQKVYHKNL